MVNTHDEWSETCGALTQFFINESTFADTLLRVAEVACRIAPADMAGITMVVEGKPMTGVFTDPDAPEIDQAQYANEHGPCLDALRDRKVYRIDSTEEDSNRPQFARGAAAYGIRSTLSLPIVARDEGLGALNLYAREVASFSDETAARMATFANHAAFVLVNAQVYWDAQQLNENLQQAMASRATIDQAIGIVMASRGCTPDEAFQVLVHGSQRENRKLREIALEIVEQASRRPVVAPAAD